jgi:hypothetical protein
MGGMSDGASIPKRPPLNVVIVAVFLTITPVLYVLSVGPAQIVVDYFPQSQTALDLFYMPLVYLMSSSDVARRWIEAYAELWR